MTAFQVKNANKAEFAYYEFPVNIVVYVSSSQLTNI